MGDEDQYRGRRREASRPMGRTVGEKMCAAVWSMDSRCGLLPRAYLIEHLTEDE